MHRRRRIGLIAVIGGKQDATCAKRDKGLTRADHAHADTRRGLMDPARALPWDRVPADGSLSGDTVYIAVVDAQGNFLGQTPWQHERPPGSDVTAVQLRKDGYDEVTVTLSGSESTDRLIHLVPSTRRPAPAAGPNQRRLRTGAGPGAGTDQVRPPPAKKKSMWIEP